MCYSLTDDVLLARNVPPIGNSIGCARFGKIYQIHDLPSDIRRKSASSNAGIRSSSSYFQQQSMSQLLQIDIFVDETWILKPYASLPYSSSNFLCYCAHYGINIELDLIELKNGPFSNSKESQMNAISQWAHLIASAVMNASTASDLYS